MDNQWVLLVLKVLTIAVAATIGITFTCEPRTIVLWWCLGVPSIILGLRMIRAQRGD